MNPYSLKMVPDETNPDQLVRLGQNQAKPDPFLSALLTWRVRNARLHKNTHSITLSQVSQMSKQSIVNNPKQEPFMEDKLEEQI